MKRLAVMLVALAFCAGAFAKDAVFCHFGVDGGISVNSYSSWAENSGSNKYGWHIGGTMLIKLPAYFAIQPTVQFEQQNSMVPASGNTLQPMRSDNLNIPVAIEWGPDLGLCRPFVQLVPFLDCTLDAKYKDANGRWTGVNDYVNPVQFGLGLGAGIDIWRIQFGLRYNWGFGNWVKEDVIPGLEPFGNNRQSFTFTIGFFFK